MHFCLIEAESEFRRLLQHHLQAEWPDADITEFAGVSDAQASPDQLRQCDAMLVGCPLPGREGLDGIEALLDRSVYPPVILFATHGDELLAVDALKAGAASYFPKQRLTHGRLIRTLIDELGTQQRRGPEDLVELHRKYRLLRQLHSTELSSVYLARSNDDAHQELAVKLLRYVPDVGSARVFDRFIQEYEIIAGIDHPNVAKIYDLGVADDHAFIAMEYLDGGRLSDRVNARLPPATALGYLSEIASALATVHRSGILHRDLKPANIMFRADGSLALIDFGLAKWVELELALTGRGQIFGTPYYMSPEQGHGESTDARADLYSLGCILYEMLTASRPFSASTDMGVIYRHAHAPRPRLDPSLARYQPLLDRLMAIRPEDRFDSALAVIDCVAGLPDSARTNSARTIALPSS